MNTMSFADILAFVTMVVSVISMYSAVALGLGIDHDKLKHALTVIGNPLIIALIVVILLLVNGRINQFEAFESGFISITIGCIIFSVIAYKS